MSGVTRETLDRLAVSGGGRIELGCTDHPDHRTSVIYQDGDLRVVCRSCGFEAARVKVALKDPAPQPQVREKQLEEALSRICDESDRICSHFQETTPIGGFADDVRNIARTALEGKETS
jgi:hypothetical protein